MSPDDFWITRIRDNRVRGLLSELQEAIADCENPDILWQLRSTLIRGFANYAAKRERDLRR